MPMVEFENAEEPRYDAETLRKVTALAQRLQAERQETLTAQEMEQIGEEVGLQRSVVREALRKVTAPRTPVARERNPKQRPMRRAVVTAWWSTGWLLPWMTALFVGAGTNTPQPAVLGWMIAWVVYIGGGIVLNGWMREAEPAPEAGAPISRHELLDALFTLQNVLQGQKEHRAFLSVDVAGSAEMKRDEPELAVEYSFGQLQRWVVELVHAFGGELHSAAGDGMMAIFRDSASALRTARALQEGMREFNSRHNRLAQPFRIRCGLTAGEVPVDPQTHVGQMHSPIIDRAAHLQKQAQPGDIVMGSELAAQGLVELGRLAPSPTQHQGEPVFSWLAGGGAAVE